MSSSTLSVIGRSHVGRVRDHNEDTAAITEIVHDGHSFHLWLVADGMGGGAKGEVASATARDEVLSALQGQSDWSDPPQNLRRAVIRANDAVFRAGTANGELSRSAMGTTLVAALIDPEASKYWVVNVGDSRAYLYSRGNLRQLTNDHSLVAEQVRAGELSDDEARTSDHRNVITRAVGTDAKVDADVFGPNELRPGERLVLCSDGLHGMISDAAISAIVAEQPMETVADALIQAANAAGGRDNVTAIVGGWDGPVDGMAAIGTVGAATSRARAVPPVAALAGGVVLVAAAAAGAWIWMGRDQSTAVRPTATPTVHVATPTVPPTPVAPTATPAAPTAPPLSPTVPPTAGSGFLPSQPAHPRATAPESHQVRRAGGLAREDS